VDHVANYRPPKDSDDLDDITKTLHAKGCGVKTPPHASSDSLSEDGDVPVKKRKGEACSCQPCRWVCAEPSASRGPLARGSAGAGCALERSHGPDVRAWLCDLPTGGWVPALSPCLAWPGEVPPHPDQSATLPATPVRASGVRGAAGWAVLTPSRQHPAEVGCGSRGAGLAAEGPSLTGPGSACGRRERAAAVWGRVPRLGKNFWQFFVSSSAAAEPPCCRGLRPNPEGARGSAPCCEGDGGRMAPGAGGTSGWSPTAGGLEGRKQAAELRVGTGCCSRAPRRHTKMRGRGKSSVGSGECRRGGSRCRYCADVGGEGERKGGARCPGWDQRGGASVEGGSGMAGAGGAKLGLGAGALPGGGRLGSWGPGQNLAWEGRGRAARQSAGG